MPRARPVNEGIPGHPDDAVKHTHLFVIGAGGAEAAFYLYFEGMVEGCFVLVKGVIDPPVRCFNRYYLATRFIDEHMAFLCIRMEDPHPQAGFQALQLLVLLILLILLCLKCYLLFHWFCNVFEMLAFIQSRCQFATT